MSVFIKIESIGLELLRRCFAILSATTLVAVLLSGCGGGSSGGGGSSVDTSVPSTGRVNGSITGLRASGTVTFRVTSGDQSKTVSVTTDGTATVYSGLSAGANYAATLISKPDGQTCTLTGANGTVIANQVVVFSVTCTENLLFAYVTNYVGNISAYNIDPSIGTLTTITGSPFTAGTAPYYITVDSNGKYAYSVSRIDNTVSTFSINTKTGALTAVSGGSLATGLDPSCITVDPSSKFAYVTNFTDNTVSAFSIDASTGALSVVPGSPFATANYPNSITVDPSGKFAFVANGGPPSGGSVSVYRINSTTGGLSPVAGSPFAAGFSPTSVYVDPSSKFVYVTNYGAGTLSAYSIDAATGALSTIPGSPFPTGNSPLSFTLVAGKYAYVVNQGGGVSAYSVNSNSGSLAAVAGSPFATGISPKSISVDPNGRFAYVTNVLNNNVSAYAIDAGTGALSAIAGSPFVAGINNPTSIVTSRQR